MVVTSCPTFKSICITNYLYVVCKNIIENQPFLHSSMLPSTAAEILVMKETMFCNDNDTTSSQVGAKHWECPTTRGYFKVSVLLLQRGFLKVWPLMCNYWQFIIIFFITALFFLQSVYDMQSLFSNYIMCDVFSANFISNGQNLQYLSL